MNLRYNSETCTFLIYLIGFFVGVLFAGTTMTIPEILGFGGVWRAPVGDLAQNLTGHLAFQSSPWGWPLLRSTNLFPPNGLSIAMTDSNPLVSLIAKILDFGTRNPQNFFGLWCAVCFTLQPISAIFAIRGFSVKRIETAIAAAILSVCFPAFLARVGHVNLLGHFYLLFALGFAIRDARYNPKLTFRSYMLRFILLLCAILSHPYLFVFCAMTLSSRMWNSIFRQALGWQNEIFNYLILVFSVVLFEFVLSETLGSADVGFGYYSMNLISPIWPYESWFFPHLPIIDATGGQYEGYNYLGLGTIIAVILAVFVDSKVRWRT